MYSYEWDEDFQAFLVYDKSERYLKWYVLESDAMSYCKALNEA